MGKGKKDTGGKEVKDVQRREPKENAKDNKYGKK